MVQRTEERFDFQIEKHNGENLMTVGRKEMSAFNLEHADVGRMQQLFEIYDAEARSLLSQGLPIPA
jgi:glycyl-tRNA synthetase alpha subunit